MKNLFPAFLFLMAVIALSFVFSSAHDDEGGRKILVIGGNGSAPMPHAASHTDGTDDIQSATNAQKGVATAAQITALEANTTNNAGTVAFHSDVTACQATAIGNLSGTNTGDQTNISGNAATVTTNANLTGHITSTGNASILGSFTVGQLNTAISDATLSGNNTGDQVFSITTCQLTGTSCITHSTDTAVWEAICACNFAATPPAGDYIAWVSVEMEGCGDKGADNYARVAIQIDCALQTHTVRSNWFGDCGACGASAVSTMGLFTVDGCQQILPVWQSCPSDKNDQIVQERTFIFQKQ